MSLTPTQMKLMKDKKIRNLLPDHRGTFTRFDGYLNTFGSDCPRLKPRYDAIMASAAKNRVVIEYIKQNYPSISLVHKVEIKNDRKSVAPPPQQPTMTEARQIARVGGVQKALRILEARKKNV